MINQELTKEKQKLIAEICEDISSLAFFKAQDEVPIVVLSLCRTLAAVIATSADFSNGKMNVEDLANDSTEMIKCLAKELFEVK